MLIYLPFKWTSENLYDSEWTESEAFIYTLPLVLLDDLK